MILGSVDDVNTERVVGWVHSSMAGGTLKVQAAINNRVIGDAEADLFRPDLAEAGLGSGYCGFEIRFDDAIDPAYLPFVETRLAGGTLVLPRTSIAGFSDYFAALYKKFPLIGRYASVLGGLWTDRTDSTALLKARADIGRITESDSGYLSRFISEGLVLVGLDTGSDSGIMRSSLPKGSASSAGRRSGISSQGSGAVREAGDLPGDIARVFFNDQLLGLLRAVLDDHPIAVKASACSDREVSYGQISAWEPLASPPECLGLIAAKGEGVSIEVLRGSHTFPEFSADGTSRWTTEGRPRVAAASDYPNTYTDVFNVPAHSVALIGPGLIHRVHASKSSTALRLLVIPARQGSARFRQKVPVGELTHRTGARIWISELAPGPVSNG